VSLVGWLVGWLAEAHQYTNRDGEYHQRTKKFEGAVYQSSRGGFEEWNGARQVSKRRRRVVSARDEQLYRDLGSNAMELEGTTGQVGLHFQQQI